jgi:hypothetical protein
MTVWEPNPHCSGGLSYWLWFLPSGQTFCKQHKICFTNVHNFTPCFSKSHFNIIIPFTFTPPKSLSGFRTKMFSSALFNFQLLYCDWKLLFPFVSVWFCVIHSSLLIDQTFSAVDTIPASYSEGA